jgi:NAD(P)-dependent dehydrogenase (short-subunit alcohol dehydrogenase family)
MIGIMRTLAVDLGADGIAVTAVAPGLTDTPIARSVNDPGQIEAVVAADAPGVGRRTRSVGRVSRDGVREPGRGP